MSSFSVFLCCLFVTFCRSTLNRLLESNANVYNSLNEIDFNEEMAFAMEEDMVSTNLLFDYFLSVMAFSDSYIAKAIPATESVAKELFHKEVLNTLVGTFSVSDEEKKKILKVADEQVFEQAKKWFEDGLAKQYHRAKLAMAKQTERSKEEQKEIKRYEKLLLINPVNLYSEFHKEAPAEPTLTEKTMARMADMVPKAFKALEDVDDMNEEKLKELLDWKSIEEELKKMGLEKDENQILQQLQKVLKVLLGTFKSGSHFILKTVKHALVADRVLKFAGFEAFRTKLINWLKEWMPLLGRLNRVKQEKKEVQEEIAIAGVEKKRRGKRDRDPGMKKYASQDTTTHEAPKTHDDILHTPYHGPKIKID